MIKPRHAATRRTNLRNNYSPVVAGTKESKLQERMKIRARSDPSPGLAGRSVNRHCPPTKLTCRAQAKRKYAYFN